VSDDSQSLTDLGGAARLFPLPNLVLFPAVMQPLHIFEPRYRQLMADALEDDRLIAMALLCPGWEENYHKRPPIHPVVCLGRIHKEERLADGRYNLLLHGLQRARVVEEVKVPKLYRVARLQLLEDVPPCSEQREQKLRRCLGEQMGRWFASKALSPDQMQVLLASSLRLGVLCDIFSFALPMPVEMKQKLLEELVVERRLHCLQAFLEAALPPEPAKAAARKFPPEFSTN
jgi:Lon protease-like protein